MDAIKSAKVHFVSGKGGVGKTLISQALAMAFAKNHKTLLVELSEEESFVERPKRAEFTSISPNLFTAKIFPDQALYEYLQLKIPTQKMLDTFFSQNLLRAMGSAMPGLADLTRLGKIWFHGDDSSGNSDDIFQKIVVDMPSSGFVARFLTIASVVRDVVKIGPLAKEAKQIDDFFSHKKNARLHLVTLLEEVVVNETLELYHQIKATKKINLGALLINRVVPFSDKSLASVDKSSIVKHQNVSNILEYFLTRIEMETLAQEKLKNIPDLLKIVLHDQMGESEDANIVRYMTHELEREFS